MTTQRPCHCGADAVREEAARWFARCNGQPLPADQRASFEHWLAEHPQHQEAFTALQELWRAADLIAPARLAALATPAARRTGRGWARYAAAASLVVALAAGSVFYAGRPATFSATYTTELGERRQVRLPDGSEVELDSRTQLAVHFEGSRREVTLREGEALFSVSHDTHRPFVVNTEQGAVTVTGTRFDVRRDSIGTRVLVEQGSVRVSGRSGGPVVLSAGLGSRIGLDGRATPATAANVAALTAWRTGQLVFDNASLAEVVREVSRYRDKPLRVAPGKASQLRLSSVFRADDTDALLRALPSMLPVAVRTLPDGAEEIFLR